MIFYVVLGFATLIGFLGFGLISMALLLLAWALTRTQQTESFPEDHRRWVKKSASVGLILHLILLAILVFKVYLVMDKNGEGWLQAFLAHWLIDHVVEALISVWLAFRVIKGASNLYSKKSPEFSG